LVSADCLRMSLDLARKHGAGIQMHCVETRFQDYCIRRSHEGRTVIHWMHDEGVLGSDVSLPHSVWIRSEADLTRLAESGAIPVHNPAANLKLGSGLMPMREMLDRGITVALGVDGACSNDNQNLFETVKLAALIHNLKHHDPRTWISAREAVEAATLGGAAVMLMKDELGELKPGKLADIVLLDERSPAISPMNDAYGLLAYCETGGSVAHVIVNGEIVVRDRKIVTFDAAAIEQEFRARVDSFPFRGALTARAKQDIADITAFWRHVMDRVMRGE
ncbi:MAG: amidohydrolase family protein, partial [Chloroflexi bacterium]|nr:amidohydrolase family protein [Chloroflexota bacterium]